MVRKYSFLFIVIASILWSFDGVLRRSLYTLPPTVVVFYEHLLGFLILLPFVVKDLPLLKTLRRQDLLAFIWISIMSGVLGTVLYTSALGQVNFIQYSVVVLLQQIEPLIALIFAWVILKEKITPKFLVWAIPAVIAAYLVSFPTLSVNISQQSGQIKAMLMAIGAAFAWGSSTAFSRFALLKYPYKLALAVRFGLTLPFALGFVYLTKSATQLTAFSRPQWLAILGIVLTTGMVAMLIYYRGLKFTQAKVSAIVELTWPLSAIFIGFYFFNERLTLTQIFGAAVLLISMYKISFMQKNHG